MTQRKSKPKLRKGEQVWWVVAKGKKISRGVLEKTKDQAGLFQDCDYKPVKIIVRLA